MQMATMTREQAAVVIANVYDGKRVAPPGATVTDFAELLRQECRKTTESVFNKGRLMIEACAGLSERAFKKDLYSRLPFTGRMAQIYMSIARNPVLTNPQYIAQLPPTVGTLYELSRIPDDDLRALIESGKITTHTERSDVKDLDFFRLEKVPAALRLLIDCMCMMPDADELGDQEQVQHDIKFREWDQGRLDVMRELPAYIEKLRARLQHHRDQRDKKWTKEVKADAAFRARGVIDPAEDTDTVEPDEPLNEPAIADAAMLPKRRALKQDKGQGRSTHSTPEDAGAASTPAGV